MKLNIRIKKEIQNSIERDTYLNHFSEIDCSLGSSPYGHSSKVDAALQSVDYKMLTSFLGTPSSKYKLETEINKLESGKGLLNINEPKIIELRQFWKTIEKEGL